MTDSLQSNTMMTMPIVEIVIELAQPLAWIAKADAAAGRQLRSKLEGHLDEWALAMAVPARFQVTLHEGEQNQGPRLLDFAVLAGGRRLAYSRDAIARVHESVTRQMFPLGKSFSTREWLRKILAGPGKATGNEMAQSLDFVASLAFDAVTSSPGWMTPEIAAAVLERASERLPERAADLARIDPHLLEPVLRGLLSFPVALRDPEKIVLAVIEGQTTGCPGARIVEDLFDSLRPDSIEIRLNPATLAAVKPDDLDKTIARLRDDVYFTFGLYLPAIGCVPSTEIPETCFQFRINDRLMPLRAALPSDRLFANETVEHLRSLHIEGIPIRDPAFGTELASISAGDESAADKAGVSVSTPFTFVTLALFGDIRMMAGRLLSIADTEYLLARLSKDSPALFKAGQSSWSSPRLLRVLRFLLEERISIRNLSSIFELLLEFHYTTGIRSPTVGFAGNEPYVWIGAAEINDEPYYSPPESYVAQFDLSHFQLLAEPHPAWLENGRLAAEFVKCGLRREITLKYSPGSFAMIVYLIDAGIEKELLNYLSGYREAPESSPFPPQRAAAILHGMAVALGEGPPDIYSAYPILITCAADAALVFRDLIARDFPETHVIHRQLIEPETNVQPMSTISAADQAVATQT